MNDLLPILPFDPDMALLHAIQQRNPVAVRAALAAGANPNTEIFASSDFHSATLARPPLLHAAKEKSHLSYVESIRGGEESTERILEQDGLVDEILEILLAAGADGVRALTLCDDFSFDASAAIIRKAMCAHEATKLRARAEHGTAPRQDRVV